MSLPPPVLAGGGGHRQWVQQEHVEMRRGGHLHRAMRRAANMWGFSRQVGELQTQPKMQQLVATLRKWQRTEVEARAQTEGAV